MYGHPDAVRQSVRMAIHFFVNFSLRSWRDAWVGEAAIFLAGKSPRGKPRVKFPPATFRMVFACRPLLSLLMNQLNKPIRERSVTWNLRLFIFYARNGPKACDSSKINLWFTWRSPITRRNVLHSHLCASFASNFRHTEYFRNTDNWKTTTLNTSQSLLFTEVSTSTKRHQRKSCKPIKSS